MLTLAYTEAPEAYVQCADIWLQASIAGHPFIEKAFWESNRQAMIDCCLPAARVLLARDDGEPAGFAAIRDDVLAALFVLPARWGQGVGRALLERLFEEHRELSLSVYLKNEPARLFYERLGFRPERRKLCPHTGEEELVMVWARAAAQFPDGLG